MLIKIVSIFLLAFLSFFSPLTARAAQKDQPEMIRVLLAHRRNTLDIVSKQKLRVETFSGKLLTEADRVQIKLADGNVWLDGKKVPDRSFLLKPAKNAFLQFGYRRYRGDLVVYVEPHGLTLINILPLEEYLYSTVSSEMYSTWPLEALKAQAVAARTYALYHIFHPEHRLYDVCDTTHCQVYDGLNTETWSSRKAVKETAGQVIIYQHAPILAVFHADSGGHTENSEDVWGTEVPYLRGVADWDYDKNPYHWKKSYTAYDIARILRSAGYTVSGGIKAVQLSRLDEKETNDRTSGGGVKRLVFQDENGQKITLSGLRARQLFGLSSTRFIVRVLHQEAAEVKNNEKNSTTVPLIQIGPTIQPKLPKDEQLMSKFSTVIFSGYGLGHRLGLSQWGAKDMAVAGKNYQEIIYKYYTNVSIGKLAHNRKKREDLCY